MNNQHIDLDKLQAEVMALKKASHSRKSNRLSKFHVVGFYILLVVLIGLSIYTIRLQRTTLAQISKLTEEKTNAVAEKGHLSKTIDDRNNLIAKYGNELATIKKDYWQLQYDTNKNSNSPAPSQTIYSVPIYTPPPTIHCTSTYNPLHGTETTCR